MADAPCLTDDAIALGADACRDLAISGSREWLETNGLGGFASSTVAGLNTRRYHGLLVAATQPPTGRAVLLSKLEATLVVGDTRFELSTNEYPGVLHPEGYRLLAGFRLDPYPVWTFDCGAVVIEESLCMVHGENTVVVRYALLSAASVPEPVTLEVRPLIAFRDYHALTHENAALDPTPVLQPGLAALTPYPGPPTLYLAHNARAVETGGEWYRQFQYARERDRGLDFEEDLYHPLTLTFDLTSDAPATVVASTEPRAAADADALVTAEVARRAALVPAGPAGPLGRTLTRAADQFIVRRGDGKTIIAGYPWFTDWSRDTMIALPGLTLATGRPEDARGILLAFAPYADHGMLPNRFPDAGEAPEYNTVDGTLWYFAAVDAYLRHTGDDALIRDHLYPVLADIVDWHVKGTRYGIGVDADGLVRAGEAGVQLTWMDARVGGWVVTPRQGKPVEIEALWYNALRVMEELAARFGNAAESRRYALMAAKARRSFNAQFWNADAGCLYDVVDGATRDASIRPNQVIALSLPHTMVGRDRALRALDVVERLLLTPVGLRTLAPSDPNYRPRYGGGVVERDSAYHQGTVWPWLAGPFWTAYLRLNGGSDKAKARVREWLGAFAPHLCDAGLGQASEVYDADPPHAPGGCIAQAWSVGDLLRLCAEV